MSLETIRNLYLAELHDLYEAEQQILLELPLLAASACTDELRRSFDEHYRETLRHIRRLDELFRHLDERPRPLHCRSLRAIIDDARLRKSQLPPGPALDAALIAFGHRVEHFEIAGYQAARHYALAVGDTVGATLLQETLKEEQAMDERLIQMALGSAGSSGGIPGTPFDVVVMGRAS
jgi:ferritin-like metal-binding protein YciE